MCAPVRLPRAAYNFPSCQPNSDAKCGSVLKVTGPASEPLNVGQALWPVWIAVGRLGVSSTRSCARIAEGQCATPAPTSTAAWRTRRRLPAQTRSLAPLSYGATKPQERTPADTHLDLPVLPARPHARNAEAARFQHGSVPSLQAGFCFHSRGYMRRTQFWLYGVTCRPGSLQGVLWLSIVKLYLQ
jgi:hypothetical protein